MLSFKHFIRGFNGNSLLCGKWLKEGFGAERRPKDRMTFRISLEASQLFWGEGGGLYLRYE
jgi:hypothetical protein